MRSHYKIIFNLIGFVLFLIFIYTVLINYTVPDEFGHVTSNSDYEFQRNTRTTVSLPLQDDLNVWCIFTKVSNKMSPIRYKLESMLTSLLNYTNSVIVLNLVVDKGSKSIAQSVTGRVSNGTGKEFRVLFHSIENITSHMDDILTAMRPHFTSRPFSYYSDALFFLSLALYRFAPESQKQIVLLDVDIQLRTDIALLFKEFNRFSSSNLFGLGPELSPVYNHLLHSYRHRMNGTTAGLPLSQGGFPGVNSGVLLLDLPKIRASKEYEKLLTTEAVELLASLYSFKGHLGDQDFYTLLGLAHPHLLYLLDCGWNRQLCTWWKNHGYQTTFENFFKCSSPTKIYHGNCNTLIPKS